MLPPHPPARRNKVQAAKPTRKSKRRPPRQAAPGVRATVAAKGALRIRPALRVLERSAPQSPVAARRRPRVRAC